MSTDLLWRLPFCKLMTSQEVTEIRALARERAVSKGDVLFKEGTRGEAAHVVLSGFLEVRKNVPGMGNTVIAQLGMNAVVGEMALLTDTPRSATVIAIEDSELLEIPKAAFDALLQKQSVAALKVCRNIAIMLAERLQKVNKDVARLTAELATHRSPEEVEGFKKILSQWSF